MQLSVLSYIKTHDSEEIIIRQQINTVLGLLYEMIRQLRIIILNSSCIIILRVSITCF